MPNTFAFSKNEGCGFSVFPPDNQENQIQKTRTLHFSEEMRAKGLEMGLLHRLILLFIQANFLVSVFLMGYVLLGHPSFVEKDGMSVYHNRYDVSLLGDTPKGRSIKLGQQLFDSTPKYLGPDAPAPYAGNRLSCNNCHLWSGTKPYGAPLIGIVQRFPQFSNRANKMGSLQGRINGCMLRSMNGRALPGDSKEMQALIAYMEWLGRYAPKSGKIQGQGFVAIQIPHRPVNLEKGKRVFEMHCVLCHGADGQGKMDPSGQQYRYPPLWGADSYNDGAGMARTLTAANFIKGNMPFGASFQDAVLTDEEAYDVAGFINQQERPKKEDLELDYPDLRKKPVSSPYGPYADHFSLTQHQLGPFPPIITYYRNQYNLIKNQ